MCHGDSGTSRPPMRVRKPCTAGSLKRRNPWKSGVSASTATGIRTPVSAVRGRRPSPLDDSGADRLRRVAKGMRLRGLEPPRALAHGDLNAARLPIPPQPRTPETLAPDQPEPRLRSKYVTHAR